PSWNSRQPHRAIRLAVSRLEGSLSQSMAQIRADKDLLRADFAMSSRITIEQLRNKMTNQAVELGKKSDIINRLNLERNELKAEVTNLRSAATQKTTQRPRQIRSAKDHGRRGTKHRNSETGTVAPQTH